MGKKKLSYLEAREYATIEEKVEAAEERVDLLDTADLLGVSQGVDDARMSA